MKLRSFALVLSCAACAGPAQESFRLQTRIGPEVTTPELLYQGVGALFRPGHRLEIANNGRVFDVVVQEIDRAQSSIHMALFIWAKGEASDRVTRAILARHAQGVSCRILVDALGSPEWRADLEALTEGGCDVRVFRPLPGVDALARNHRKLAIIDGKVGITGGFGIRDNWLGDGVHDDGWRDSNVKVEGPAVRDMQQAFAANWLEAGGDVLPADAFPTIEAAGTTPAAFIPSSGAAVGTSADRLVQFLLLSAKKRAWISNAYFMPTEAISGLLKEKAAAGIDVRLLTAGAKSDSKSIFVVQRSEYGGLRKAGVRIWEYQPSMIHSKTMLIDDDLVLIGSINLEPLSLNKLEEGAIVAQDPSLAQSIAKIFEEDCGLSSEMP